MARPQKFHRRIIQAGFTLLELVIVVIIIGILAAVAIPNFVGFSDKAELSAVKGLAGNLASAAAMNYGAYTLNASYTTVTDCAGVGALVSPPIDSTKTTEKYAIKTGSTTAGKQTCIVYPRAFSANTAYNIEFAYPGNAGVATTNN